MIPCIVDDVNMSCDVTVCTFIANEPQCMPWLSTNDSNTLGQIKTSLQKENSYSGKPL